MKLTTLEFRRLRSSDYWRCLKLLGPIIARFVLNRWGLKDSVTEMLSNLKWSSLENRRKQSRLTMFYKIHNNLVPITFENMQLLEWSNSSEFNYFAYMISRTNTISYQKSFLLRTIRTIGVLSLSLWSVSHL